MNKIEIRPKNILVLGGGGGIGIAISQALLDCGAKNLIIASRNIEKLKELDTEFHDIIFRASGNRLLCKILSELHRNIRTYRKIALTVPGRLERTIEEHKGIVSAIEARDADLADKLTFLHTENAMKNMIIATEGEEM